MGRVSIGMLGASDGSTGGMAATHQRGRTMAADVEYAPCGECALGACRCGRAGQSAAGVAQGLRVQGFLSTHGGSL